MKAERCGKKFEKFRLELDLTELLTLCCLMAEGQRPLRLYSDQFQNPEKIKRIMNDLVDGVDGLLMERTPEEMQVKFFKIK